MPIVKDERQSIIAKVNMMRISTNRFGTLNINSDELFLFPQGLIGMEMLRQWALLPDQNNPSVAWLQSLSRGDRSVPLISPRAFFDDYRVRISQRDLEPLHLTSGAELYVLTTISGREGNVNTNLRAPIVLNLDRRLGCQVIAENALSVRHNLSLHSVTKANNDSFKSRAA